MDNPLVSIIVPVYRAEKYLIIECYLYHIDNYKRYFINIFIDINKFLLYLQR